MLSPETRLKINNIFLIIFITLIFGISYNFFFYPHTLIEFIEAGSISVFLGLIIGLLEEFILKTFFERISALSLSIIRTIFYSLLISIILALVLSIEISIINDITYSTALGHYFMGLDFKRDLLFSLAFIIITLFIVQMIQFIGRKSFFKLFIGLYHKPREVSRIFMFLDLKNSTSLAEKMNTKMYSAFVKDFFNDISEAVLMFKGEIYQYAGDEAIIVWPQKRQNANCLRSFFKTKEIINHKRKSYLSKYNTIPEFKAGVHAGKVVVTTVGKYKKEIVYHGDVLNTASRIEGKCNVLDQNLLISKNILPFVTNEFEVHEKGEIELRGKNIKLALFAVSMKQ